MTRRVPTAVDAETTTAATAMLSTRSRMSRRMPPALAPTGSKA